MMFAIKDKKTGHHYQRTPRVMRDGLRLAKYCEWVGDAKKYKTKGGAESHITWETRYWWNKAENFFCYGHHIKTDTPEWDDYMELFRRGSPDLIVVEI